MLKPIELAVARNILLASDDFDLTYRNLIITLHGSDGIVLIEFNIFTDHKVLFKLLLDKHEKVRHIALKLLLIITTNYQRTHPLMIIQEFLKYRCNLDYLPPILKIANETITELPHLRIGVLSIDSLINDILDGIQENNIIQNNVVLWSLFQEFFINIRKLAQTGNFAKFSPKLDLRLKGIIVKDEQSYLYDESYVKESLLQNLKKGSLYKMEYSLNLLEKLYDSSTLIDSFIPLLKDFKFWVDTEISELYCSGASRKLASELITRKIHKRIVTIIISNGVTKERFIELSSLSYLYHFEDIISDLMQHTEKEVLDEIYQQLILKERNKTLISKFSLLYYLFPSFKPGDEEIFYL